MVWLLRGGNEVDTSGKLIKPQISGGTKERCMWNHSIWHQNLVLLFCQNKPLFHKVFCLHLRCIEWDWGFRGGACWLCGGLWNFIWVFLEGVCISFLVYSLLRVYIYCQYYSLQFKIPCLPFPGEKLPNSILSCSGDLYWVFDPLVLSAINIS